MLALSVPQSKHMGVDVSRRQISGRERASCLALGLLKCGERGLGMPI